MTRLADPSHRAPRARRPFAARRTVPTVLVGTAVAAAVGIASVAGATSTPPSDPATGPSGPGGSMSSEPVLSEPVASGPASSEPAPGDVPAPLTDPAAPFDPSERIVAVTDDGRVVVIPVAEDGAAGEPFAVLDVGADYVDGVALDADRSTAFVGVCCSPGTIHVATADGGETDSFEGSAPVTSPDRASLAHVLGTSIVVVDIESGESSVIETAAVEDGDSDSFTPFDVAWISDDEVVAFGATDTQSFEFRSYDVASGSLVTSAPASDGGQPNFYFVGIDLDGAVVVVDIPLEPTMDSVLLRLDPATLTPSPAGPDAATVPAGTQSASLNAAATHLLLVDADGVLTIDGTVLVGTYRWAAWS